MTLAISVILTLLAVLLAIPCTVFFIECAVGGLLRNGRTMRSPISSAGMSAKVAVLIPAHDEQASVARTVSQVLAQTQSQDRVVVVADNCADFTADEARDAGAEVVVRIDHLRRGKGYALAGGIEYLASQPPDIVVMLDADTQLKPGSMDALRCMAADLRAPVQTFYRLRAPDDGGTRDLLSSLAFLVKNLVRPLGASALGMPCHLFGSGIACPWSLLCNVSLASGNIVEDLQLGIDFAIQGHPAQFCVVAEVDGTLPSSSSAARSQRTRWEHGYVLTLLSQVPRLVLEAVRQRRFDLLAMALDLSIPPLSLLLMLCFALSALDAMWAAATGSVRPLLISFVALAQLISGVLFAWSAFGRKIIPARQLLGAWTYLIWKLPLYGSLLVRPQQVWVRTARAK